MSRKRSAARRRSSPRRAAATPRAGVAASAAVSSRLPDDPVVAYREAAGYGRTIRVALLLAVLLLDLPLFTRAAVGHDAPPALGASGIAAMAFFFGAVFIRHLAALHRIRSRQRELLQPSRRLIAGMLKAPFGIGDPRRTAFDRAVLRATVVLAAAFPPLLIVAGSRA